MQRFAPQPILSTTKLRKMIDVGAVYSDPFRFVSFLLPIRRGTCLDLNLNRPRWAYLDRILGSLSTRLVHWIRMIPRSARRDEFDRVF